MTSPWVSIVRGYRHFSLEWIFVFFLWFEFRSGFFPPGVIEGGFPEGGGFFGFFEEFVEGGFSDSGFFCAFGLEGFGEHGFGELFDDVFYVPGWLV